MRPILPDLSAPVPSSLAGATLQMLDARVPAGFPSAAEDHMVRRCDLMDLLGAHPQSTFFMRVRGNSMTGAGIHDNDIISVDRALEPRHGSIVVAIVDSEFTCKRLSLRGGRAHLVAAHPAYPDIHPGEGQALEVWGVVTAALTLFPC